MGLLMGLFRGAVNQIVRFPSLVGRFPPLMGHSPESLKWAVCPLENLLENSPFPDSPTLAFLEKQGSFFLPKKLLFADPLKSLEKEGKTKKKNTRKIGKRKKQGNRKKKERVREKWEKVHQEALDLSGPILRDAARLSQRYPPIARYGVFWHLNMANWVRYPPPPFLSVSLLGEQAKWRGDTPPSKGVSQRYWRDTLSKQGKSVRYPPLRYSLERVLCDMGGVSRTGPLSSRSFFYPQRAQRLKKFNLEMQD